MRPYLAAVARPGRLIRRDREARQHTPLRVRNVHEIINSTITQQTPRPVATPSPCSAETPAKLRHSGESRPFTGRNVHPEGSDNRGPAGFPFGALSTNGFCRGLAPQGDHRKTLPLDNQGGIKGGLDRASHVETGNPLLRYAARPPLLRKRGRFYGGLSSGGCLHNRGGCDSMCTSFHILVSGGSHASGSRTFADEVVGDDLGRNDRLERIHAAETGSGSADRGRSALVPRGSQGVSAASDAEGDAAAASARHGRPEASG